MTLQLTIAPREIRGKKNSDLRAKGEIPAVVYGPKQEAKAIAIKLSEFEKVFKEAGESTLVVLTGLGEDIEVLVQEVTTDPLTGIPVHADFYAIEKGKKVEVEVPIHFVGESPAVKTLGAQLVKVLHEITVEAEPRNLPHGVEVDISVLVDFESQIHVSDIKVGAGVEIKNNPEDVVALSVEAKEEVIEEVPAAIDMDAIEVEKKGKEEGAEGAAEEKPAE